VNVPDLRFGFAPLPEPVPGYDPAGDARAIAAASVPSPASDPIPGRQLFESLGPGHRFVVRVPDAWNGKLAACGTPATRSECASDAVLGDFLLSRGYAYVASNKGIRYNAIAAPLGTAGSAPLDYLVPFDSATAPAGTIALHLGALDSGATPLGKWHEDLADVIVAARDLVASLTGRPPSRTYALGLSIGGGQVRWLLEQRPELADGGIEWAAVHWRPQENILAYLPAFLRLMPAYVASGYRDRDVHDAIVAAGFPPDRVTMAENGAPSRSLWDAHYSALPPYYSDLTTFLFAKLLDGHSDVATLETRASYVPSDSARAAIEPFAHTGRIERPLIGIAGEADVFITPLRNALPYLELVRAARRADRYWQYLVADGTHVDSYTSLGWNLRPLAPFVWKAFEKLVAIVEGAERPPGAGTSQRVETGAIL